jgi:hypothetical protein
MIIFVRHQVIITASLEWQILDLSTKTRQEAFTLGRPPIINISSDIHGLEQTTAKLNTAPHTFPAMNNC